MLKPLPDSSRDHRIRAEFSRVGGMSTAAFTHHLLGMDFWDEDERYAFAFRAAQNQVREALNADDEQGLPFAGRTTAKDDDGAHVWRQRLLWSLDDYALNVSTYVGQRNRLDDKVAKLTQECIDRFGIAPLGGAAAAD